MTLTGPAFAGVLAHAMPGAGLRWWYPEVLAVILAFCTLYLYLVGPYRERWGLAEEVEPRRVQYFLAAMAVMAIAEASPIHDVSERYLFSVHMSQHVLLTMVMAPLLIVGTPPWLIRRAFRWPGVKALLAFLTRPVIALLAFNLVNAAWHLPLFYQAPLITHWLHPVQHVILVVTALMMWWPLVSEMPELPRLSYGGQVIYIFLILLVQLPIFAGITFSDSVFYEFYAAAPDLWGMAPLADQQAAGVVMKLGGMIILLYFMGRAVFRWAREEGASDLRGQRSAGPGRAAGGLTDVHAS
ncbi:MAG TPA: cytochrome c oxidase assembly protein [Limnochordales bacterium]